MTSMQKHITRTIIFATLIVLASVSCKPAEISKPVPQAATVVKPSEATPEIPTAVTLTLIPADSPTPPHTPTMTPTPTNTPTITPAPTYAILRGKVLELSNCRYGPGAPYLYKYGLLKGNVLEIIGRNERGTWAYVQAIGGSNPCWVKASLMEIKGDVMSVAPVYPPLPKSPYYPPPAGVLGARKGNEVEISWNDIPLRAGDEEGFHYLIEAWLCQDGQLIFTPVGTDELAVILTDAPGCSEPSHGRLYTAEKHGYSNWVEIPWPPHEATPRPG